MKQFRRFLWALLLIGMAIAIYSSAVGETAPEKINWGGAEPAAGSWARTADAMEFSCPMDAVRDEPTILLRSAWQKYQVLVDGNVVYTASSERNGAFHLFRLPPGQELTVRFLDCAPGSGAESAVLQSQVYFGSRSGIQWMILRENLYAVLFSGFALVLGIACLLAAYCMQRQHFGNLYGSVYSLGAYILLAGVWVLTDSKILLLVSQKAGLAGLIPYLSFYALHLPLLQFTIGVLPEKRRMLEILQAFYSGLLLLLMANFILSLPYLNVLVMAEHLLMTVTIALILYHGFREMRRGKNKALGRVMAGYVLFAVCSILAITIYYLDSSLPYSPVYMLGIFGFILLLAETAGQRVLEQINKNANMAVYAKLAYRDVLTGLGNRAAFVRETQETKQSAAPFGYIMVDVNDLKKVNDTLGHPKGDALINRVFHYDQKINTLLKTFVRESTTGIPYMNSLMLCLLTETIIRLLQGTYASPMAPASSTAHQSAMDELFDRIIAYIDDNIYDPLTIPEICEHFSLSRSALQLLFKNSVDQSPKKYINDKKLERSCQMLLENRYTISEISLRLGYSSIHYFSKSFNMKYHMSPSEFVKQNCQSSV